jgi:hypothetical protein
MPAEPGLGHHERTGREKYIQLWCDRFSSTDLSVNVNQLLEFFVISKGFTTEIFEV